MRQIIKALLPDLLAGVGAGCIVVALWMVCPSAGLGAAGAALIGAAVIASLPRGRGGGDR